MKFYDNLILNEVVIVIFVYLYFHSIKKYSVYFGSFYILKYNDFLKKFMIFIKFRYFGNTYLKRKKFKKVTCIQKIPVLKGLKYLKNSLKWYILLYK